MTDECIGKKLRNDLLEVIDEQISIIDSNEQDRHFHIGDELSQEQHRVIGLAVGHSLEHINKIKTFVEDMKSC